MRGLEHPVEVVRVGLGVPDEGHVPDPVCGIPLVRELARRDQDRQVRRACAALLGELPRDMARSRRDRRRSAGLGAVPEGAVPD